MKHTSASETFVRLVANDSAMFDLLDKAGLPTSDLQGSDKRFIGIRDGSQLIAAGGLEPYGTYGLLRSLAVAEGHRGFGNGQKITRWLISEARSLRLKELYLLTTTAERFFQRIGFECIERRIVPEEIKHTKEFGELCPASAIVMRFKL